MNNPGRFVYRFNSRTVDGGGDMRDILGGKGAGLATMSQAGLPVPPGFTISTEACGLYNDHPEVFEAQVWPEVVKALRDLEKVAGRTFGDASNPLLLSVRSGAKFSMPGMMDTVLNLGLNDAITTRLAEDDAAFAHDSYRRLLQMFGDVVLEVPDRLFEKALATRRKEKQVRFDFELGPEQLAEVCEEFKAIISGEGKLFPEDPEQQLRQSVEAVFRSWMNPRAVTYRKLNDIPEDLGTAVNVQMMVFGNRGKNSGSGVGFTRNPSTGEAKLYGEYLPQSQGEEVVAGIRTPLGFEEMQEQFPEAYRQLQDFSTQLEQILTDMQDFEFAIEDGVLYMLQTRAGKRTGVAAVKIALDMYKEELINRDTAILRVDPEQLNQLLHPVFKEGGAEAVATGLPASPGASVGRIVFNADDAVTWAHNGEPVILVRTETTPDDIHGMEACQGILTARGGMTSHAAVVARGMGKCCVAGCESLDIDEDGKAMKVAGHTLKEGDYISVDGNQGRVMLGQVERIEPDTGGGLLGEFMELVEEIPAMGVRANADTPRDSAKAREFGAIGIGLCRTEHMFFAEDRLPIMQDMLMADTTFEREQALEKLREFQRADFKALLEVMDGMPVTIRLLDPPLHEFLPEEKELTERIARLGEEGAQRRTIQRAEQMLHRTQELHEENPMLGHRGCRLGISLPEITRMQVRAMFEAACQLKQEGRSPIVEVMIPLVSLFLEFTAQAELIRETAEAVIAEAGVRPPYLVGTMIELPRACLVADEIARQADFFSFGTNDLTQTTFGFSRDDAGKFIKIYQESGILPHDPFQSVDQVGVGELVRIACERGRGERSDLKLGVCGEHGGDPASVVFFNQLNLDYVSCSPFRVPVARLASAQAAIHSSDRVVEKVVVDR